MILSHEEWAKINTTIELLWLPVDEKTLRKNLLNGIKQLIPYTLGGFCNYYTSGDSNDPKIENYIMTGDFSQKFMQEHADLYDKKYGKHDYTKWLLGCQESIVCRESDIINKDAKEKTHYYNEFLKPRNLLYCMDCYIIKDNIKPFILFFYRDDLIGDFTDKEVYMLNILMPHIEGRFVLNAMNVESHRIDDAFSRYLKENYALTYREIEVARLIKEGYNNKEISEELFIEISTVKKHVSNILSKTEAETRIKLLKLLDLAQQQSY